MNICRHCVVSGRVQGVFFRDTTRRKARELGVSGFARNLADGTVEVFACGNDTAVNALCEWLWQGPSSAQVLDVGCEAREYDPVDGFTIR
jgi:acylphosphatase